MDDRHLTLSEVAGLMGVSERTIRRWIKSGRFRAYKPGRDYRIPESSLRAFVEESEISPKALRRSPFEPSLEDALADERREAIYRSWADFVNRYVDRWEARIAAADFDLASIEEFGRVSEDIMETLGPLGLREKQEQPPGYIYSYGPITGQAIDRLMDLLNPMLAAAAKKFPREVSGDELEPLRRRRDERLRELRRGA
jgi:excisionase family DNA binding protein